MGQRVFMHLCRPMAYQRRHLCTASLSFDGLKINKCPIHFDWIQSDYSAFLSLEKTRIMSPFCLASTLPVQS